MKQIKIVNAYSTTEELAKQSDLPITIKWLLFNLRKSLVSYYTFYVEESQKLFSQYETTKEGNNIIFESTELAEEYKTKQNEIDNFEVDMDINKQTFKLSDVPNLTIEQMEALDNFIEFIPE